MTKEVKNLLKQRDAYRAGDIVAYSLAKANLKQGIKTAKFNYKLRIENSFNDGNSRHMW